MSRDNFFNRFINHSVAKNALALYALQFAGYVVPFLTIPYIARVLRPEEFGYLAFTQSFALAASLIVEYGFNLSASREVASAGKGKKELGVIFAKVTGAKLILITVLLFTIVPFVWISPVFKQKPDYFIWAFLYIAALGFSPFWYFQGTEKMVVPVLIEFSLRLLSTAAVFVIVKTLHDGWKVLALQTTSGLLNTAITLSMVYRQISWRSIDFRKSLSSLREGWNMFIFRTASSLYITAGILILGLLKSSSVVGYYSGADKIYRASISLLLPFSQAVYPRINFLLRNDRKRALNWMRSTLFATGGVSIGLSLAIASAAPWLVAVLFGQGYEATVPALRILAAVLPVTAVNMVLGGQWLLPHHLEKTSGRIILFGAGLNILLTLCLVPKLFHLGVAWAVMISELAVFITYASVLRVRNLFPLTSINR